LRFHAVRGAVRGACGIAFLIFFDWMSRDATHEYVWFIALFITSLMTVQQLRSQSETERAAEAPPTTWQQQMQYGVVTICIVVLVVFVAQALDH
jgi:membrane protein insertase Oxa1/YidC/SpoIIIJ